MQHIKIYDNIISQLLTLQYTVYISHFHVATLKGINKWLELNAKLF